MLCNCKRRMLENFLNVRWQGSVRRLYHLTSFRAGACGPHTLGLRLALVIKAKTISPACVLFHLPPTYLLPWPTSLPIRTHRNLVFIPGL